MPDLSLLDLSLELTVGMIAHAATLADEHMQAILAVAAPPLPGWERNVKRSCDRTHTKCGGIGVFYELKERPKLHLRVYECECTKYELVYSPILIPSDRQLTSEAADSPFVDPLQTEIMDD